MQFFIYDAKNTVEFEVHKNVYKTLEIWLFITIHGGGHFAITAQLDG